MKKIISLLVVMFISGYIYCQNIDTVLVRNLQFQAQDWAWLIGKNIGFLNRDSATAREFRRIRDRIRTANPATFTVNVTIDSIPGWAALAFYKTTKTANAGEIAARYSAITASIEGKANMTSFINTYNTALANDFTNNRDTGKHVVMDN